MRIVYFIDKLGIGGGTAKITTLKANYLASKGYEIYFIRVESKNITPYFKLDPAIKIISLAINYGEVANKYHKFDFFRRRKLYKKKVAEHKNKVKKVINEIEPDIVISLYGSEYYFLDEINIGKAKKIIELHFSKEGMLNYGNYRINRNLYRLQLAYIYKKNEYRMNSYDAIVHLTERDRRYWGGKENSIVISNFNLFKNTTDKEPNYDSKTIISLAYNITEKVKGYDLLIKSWSVIANKFPKWKLKIIGDGDATQLKEMAKKLNCNVNVRFEPSTKDVKSVYMDSSIYVSSSRHEGFGLVLIEAMTCGLPVVSFDSPSGPGEIITNEEDGLLVDHLNIKQMAEKIERLILNKDELILMGENARRNMNRFDQKVIMTKWEELFKNIV